MRPNNLVHVVACT
ncbi:hypothetical protein F383_12385 [Gossypium arboreum]|nr:hypothetical protein F383_16546 [Gossypium arboreum]KHG24164.1 hypothetical protein F383_31722 [Gossypium arboreum]KHG30220.1 hypothetical protein F383_12385 [Gossypium arboreum]